MPRQPILDTPGGLHHVMGRGIEGIDIFSQKGVVKCRRIFCQIAVRKMGYSGADVARFLDVTTSAVNRLGAFEVLSDTEEYY